jgi:hypothetical protein
LMKIVGAKYGDIPAAADWDLNAPHHAKVKFLSTRTSTGGSTPTGSPKGWDQLQKVGLTGLRGDWKRMHMITAGIGGSGGAGNLVPAPTSVNSGSAVRGFEVSVEALVKRENPQTRKPNVVWVEVVSGTFHPGWEEKNRGIKYDGSTFAAAITFAAGLHYPDEAGEWVKDPTAVLNVPVTVPNPQGEFEGQPIDLNTVGRVYIAEAAGVTPYFARQIAQRRDERGGWTDITDFVDDMEQNRQKGNVELTSEFRDGLKTVARAVRQKQIRFGD